MRKKYTKSEMEIIAFDTEDVITTSGTPTGEDATEDDDGYGDDLGDLS